MERKGQQELLLLACHPPTAAGVLPLDPHPYSQSRFLSSLPLTT